MLINEPATVLLRSKESSQWKWMWEIRKNKNQNKWTSNEMEFSTVSQEVSLIRDKNNWFLAGTVRYTIIVVRETSFASAKRYQFLISIDFTKFSFAHKSHLSTKSRRYLLKQKGWIHGEQLEFFSPWMDKWRIVLKSTWFLLLLRFPLRFSLLSSWQGYHHEKQKLLLQQSLMMA